MTTERRYAGKAFQLVGGYEGVSKLCNTFYDIMESSPEAKRIRDMHPADLSETRENLALFLSGWLGGPALYTAKFGRANLGEIHLFFDIGYRERDMWLACMEKALKKHPIEEDFRAYLLKRFTIPAERIRITCQQQVRGLPVLLPGSYKNR